MKRSGSNYALYLIRKAERNGEKLSIRQAAIKAKVTHVAVSKMMHKKEEHVGPVLRFGRITYIRNAVLMANKAKCPFCDEITGYSIKIKNYRCYFKCAKCHRQFGEDQIGW